MDIFSLTYFIAVHRCVVFVECACPIHTQRGLNWTRAGSNIIPRSEPNVSRARFVSSQSEKWVCVILMEQIITIGKYEVQTLYYKTYLVCFFV